MSENLHSGDDYEKHLDVDFYLKAKAEAPHIEATSVFHYKWLTDLGKQGKIGGRILLEIGTGPVLQNAAAVAPYFDRIVFSDHSEKLRKWLHNWSKGESSTASDCLIQRVLDIEESRQSVREREKEMRDKLHSIIPIDVKKTYPHPNTNDTFDTVIAKYLVDAVARGEQEYASILDNIANLLPPGGLFINMELACDSYIISNATFQGSGLSENEIRKIWENSKFDLLVFDVQYYDYNGVVRAPFFNILARKK